MTTVSPVAPAVLVEGSARYRAEIVQAYALGSGECALMLRGDAEPTLVPHAFASAADALLRFRSIDEHAREIAAVVGDAMAEHSVRRVLEHLVAGGLLASEADLLRPRRHVGYPARILASAVLTSDRAPLDLVAAVRSAIDHARVANRVQRVMVMDDARDRTVQRRNREALRAIADRTGASIAYAGLAEKIAYAERLAAESGVDRATARFALGLDDLAFGPTVGGNRNAILLHHVGEAFQSLDDGVELTLARHPRASSTLAFLSECAEETFAYDDAASLLAALEPASETIFEVHEAMLGLTLHDLAAQAFGRGHVDLDGMTPAMLRGASSSKARVVATLTGTYGDGDAGAALSVAKQPTVQRPSPFDASSFAIDARHLLPPFFPAGRGEDALFGRTLERCFEDHFVGRVPRAVFRGRAREEQPPRRAGLPHRLTDLVASCVADAPRAAGVGDARSRLAIAGRHLVAVARSPLNAMRGYLHGHRLAAVERASEKTPDSRPTPEQIRHDWDLPASDLGIARSAEEAWQLARRQLRAFGELLEAWPAMYEAAQRLRVADVRVAHVL